MDRIVPCTLDCPDMRKWRKGKVCSEAAVRNQDVDSIRRSVTQVPNAHVFLRCPDTWHRRTPLFPITGLITRHSERTQNSTTEHHIYSVHVKTSQSDFLWKSGVVVYACEKKRSVAVSVALTCGSPTRTLLTPPMLLALPLRQCDPDPTGDWLDHSKS